MKLLLCGFSPRKKNYSSKGDVRIFDPFTPFRLTIYNIHYAKQNKFFKAEKDFSAFFVAKLFG